MRRARTRRSKSPGSPLLILAGGGILVWWLLAPSGASAAQPESADGLDTTGPARATSPLARFLTGLGITVAAKAAPPLLASGARTVAEGISDLGAWIADLLAPAAPLTTINLPSLAFPGETMQSISTPEILRGVYNAPNIPTPPTPDTVEQLVRVFAGPPPAPVLPPLVPADMAPIPAGLPGYGIGEEAASGLVQGADVVQWGSYPSSAAEFGESAGTAAFATGAAPSLLAQAATPILFFATNIVAAILDKLSDTTGAQEDAAASYALELLRSDAGLRESLASNARAALLNVQGRFPESFRGQAWFGIASALENAPADLVLLANKFFDQFGTRDPYTIVGQVGIYERATVPAVGATGSPGWEADTGR